MENTRVCPGCGVEKPLNTEYFHRGKDTKEGFKSRCKECRNKEKKQYREANKDRINEQAKEYHIKNRENRLKYSREYYQENKERRKEYNAEWQRNNPEKVKEKDKRYRERHPDKVKDTQKRYYEENKEKRQEYYARPDVKAKRRERERLYFSDPDIKKKRSEYKKEYRQRPEVKEKTRMYKQSEQGKLVNKRHKHRRRTKEKEALATLSLDQWYDCMYHFSYRCCYCGEETELTQDHFIPVSKGGEYTVKNITPCCGSCNSSKLNRNFDEWYPKQSFYSEEREQRILDYLGYINKKQQMAFF